MLSFYLFANRQSFAWDGWVLRFVVNHTRKVLSH